MNLPGEDTIVALSTARGTAALAVIRMSGKNCLSIVSDFCFSKNKKKISESGFYPRKANFILFMHDSLLIDEVVLTYFKGPSTYTGEDTIEISCHGSPYIQQKIIQLLLGAGARMANPGEFTMRAFMNGKLDLSQAEAVADLIVSNSPVSHQLALKQMRGGFSGTIQGLRDDLIRFASLIELELDFSEEDVEFADRKELYALVTSVIEVISRLVKSFEMGNVLREGIPVVIVGRPNAGKSTLLNALLEDDKAIVSEIPGTTRDVIEDVLVMGGVQFRFIDTAGLRVSDDVIEQIGVSRSYAAMQRSSVVIYLFDVNTTSESELQAEIASLTAHSGEAHLLLVGNKIDSVTKEQIVSRFEENKTIHFISAKQNKGVSELKEKLLQMFDLSVVNSAETIVTNARHAASLVNAQRSLEKVREGIGSRIPGDLLALDLRFALQELGHITGQVTNEDLLENIFTRFCIGK